MNTNKIVAGMALMAGMSGFTGCMSLTTSPKQMAEEKIEIRSENGVTTTNSVMTTVTKPEYNYFGKTVNAVEGTFIGIAGGIYAGHMLGSDTNGMANASFFDKAWKYTKSMGQGIATGTKLGAEYGWNRTKEAEYKAEQEAILRKYQAEKSR